MNVNTFEKRLSDGKANNLVYSKDGKDGLVSVWMHDSRIILTWEECPRGEQYDESTYGRDDRFVFGTLAELMAFLSQNKLGVDLFTP